MNNNKTIDENYFYSNNRWKNWISQINDCSSNIEKDDEKITNIFINMIDDIILSCLKIIARYDKKYINKIESYNYLLYIKKIVSQEIKPINESIDTMFYSMKNSLQIIFSSFETYINNTFDSTIDINLMMEEALLNIQNNKIEDTYYILSMIGATLISGKKFNFESIYDIIEKQQEIIIEWVEGLESIQVSMNGTDDYKNFDNEDEE